MESKLDRLLNRIDPTRTTEDIERSVDNAINSFRIPGGRVESWAEFRDCVSGFLCHVENVVLDLDPPRALHAEIDFGRACRFLMKEFGPEGEKAAARMAIHGVEGGLYRILKVLGHKMAMDYSANAVETLVSQYWKGLTLEEKMQAPLEYLARFQHILPADVLEDGTARLRAFFPKVLAKHPDLIRRLRSVGR